MSDWLDGQPEAVAVAVIPVGADPEASVPPRLRRLQHIRWDGDAARVAQDVIDAVDPDTLERRVFISYSHEDGVDLANAVGRVLAEARFSVFLDSFTLRPGDDFAERIEHELAEKAFVVLIETEGALKSGWVVDRELRYAREHRLGIASVRPEESTAPLLPGIGHARRWRLAGASLLGGNGGPTLDESEAEGLRAFFVDLHLESTLRRRRQVDASLRKAIGTAGLGPLEAAVGGFRVEAAGTSWYLATRPRPAGLLDMHAAHRREPPSDRTVMISATPPGQPEKEALAWLTAESGISHWDEGRLMPFARALRRGNP